MRILIERVLILYKYKSAVSSLFSKAALKIKEECFCFMERLSERGPAAADLSPCSRLDWGSSFIASDSPHVS